MVSSPQPQDQTQDTISQQSPLTDDHKSYRDLSGSEILSEIQQLQSQGIIYSAKENIASQCEFVYNKERKGSILIPKDDTNNISEFVLTGVFEIDPRSFFMTSDGKWNSNNPLGLPFHQVKPSCCLLPVRRDINFDFSINDFPSIITNIHAIELLANPRRSRDVSSFVTGDPPSIKIVHHLFTVRHLLLHHLHIFHYIFQGKKTAFQHNRK